MKNAEIAELLEKMGTLLEIKGENVFKIKAYYKAADNIRSLSEDIVHIKEQKRLREIPGVGEAIAEKITEYLDRGKVTAYEELTKEVPESLLEIVQIPSVGPKKAKLFFDQLKITNRDELHQAIKQGKLLGVEGIKEKTIENILRGLEIVQAGQERMNLGDATRIAEEFINALKKLPQIKEISIAGSLRRGQETVRDIDILVVASEPSNVMEAFIHLPQVRSVNAHGETKSSIMTHQNVQVDLRVMEPKTYGAALLYFTGSKNFNIKLRQIAIKKKMKVSEYGIFSLQGEQEKFLAGKTEDEYFKALGLAFVPPELREDIGEAEFFETKKIPTLIEQKDIQGELHVHSTWSDGHNTIAQMAEAARNRGYKYLAISDHSAKLRVARGVSAEDLKKKKKEIDDLNARYKDFRILFGSEVEIDKDGNLDYNEKILSEFDIVIASIHSGFEQSSEQLTNRLIKACQNKYVNIIGHPTCVHLGKRPPIDVDFKKVCEAAVQENVFLEINAFPVRLDLNSSNVYFARREGVKFAINTDSHHIEHMNHMRFGITIARRGWLTKADVLNTLSLEELLKKLKKKG